MTAEPAMKYIENEGALFRGPSRSFPNDVWNPDNREFAPYAGVIPKPMELGSVISAAAAEKVLAAQTRLQSFGGRSLLETKRLPRTTAAGTGLSPDNHHRRSRRVGRTTATAGREFPPETTAPRAGMVPTSVMPCPSSQPPLRRPAWPAPRARAAGCAPRVR